MARHVAPEVMGINYFGAIEALRIQMGKEVYKIIYGDMILCSLFYIKDIIF